MTKRWCVVGLLTFAVGVVVGADREGPPTWAYGTDPALAAIPAKASTEPAGALRHLPGTDKTFTMPQIQDRFGPADWRPEEHPAMPEIVAHGRKPDIWACALCHFPNGQGKPENAGVAGLPVSYFIAQMHEFREGQRMSADARKKNTGVMASIAKAMTEDEIRQAAEYYGSIPWKKPWIRVVEAMRVPKTRTSVGLYVPIEGAGDEPIGARLIEVPVNPEATEELRDPDSGFIAYVPPGTLAKGKRLVEGGNGRTTACGVCHGADLKGMGPVPGIAGRSASYLTRQLYDMQQGTRHGEWTELMKPVVQNLSQDDMLAIAAYTASIKP